MYRSKTPTHSLCWCVKEISHAPGNAGCPQQKQTERTWDLPVPLNNRTVHFLLWNEKTVKKGKKKCSIMQRFVFTQIKSGGWWQARPLSWTPLNGPTRTGKGSKPHHPSYKIHYTTKSYRTTCPTFLCQDKLWNHSHMAFVPRSVH